MISGLEHRQFDGADGTRIAYQVRGAGPAVVLLNGLGGTYEAFRHVYGALGPGYRVVCWDYRGLFGSAAPADRATLTVRHQADDLARLLEVERIDRAVFIGWSMGVQVAYEFCRARKERVSGVVAINGTAGLAFRTAMSSRVVGVVLPTMLRLMRTQARLIGATTRTWLGWDRALPVMQRAGLVSRHVDVDAFRAVAAGFASMDWDVYLDTLHRLETHDAWDVVPTVTAPTLVISGDRDLLTPATTAERIHALSPGSRLIVIPGGTHYTPVEFPHIIGPAVRDLLGRVPGWEPAAAPLAAAAPGATA